jgi:hypothetical protein
MKDPTRDAAFRKLMNDGSGCKRGNKLMDQYSIGNLHRGVCRSRKAECWLYFCEDWVGIDTLLSNSTSGKRVVKPLFVSQTPGGEKRSMVVIKLDKSGISQSLESKDIKIGDKSTC